MEQTLTFLFCEGKHEPPFIRRLLKVDGWRNRTDQPMTEYPNVLQRYLLGELNKYATIEESVSWTRKIGFMPWYVLRKRQNNLEHFIVIWDTGGDSNYKVMNEVLKSFKVIKNTTGFGEITSIPINVALFYDADKSISDRIKTVQSNLSEILPNFCSDLRNEEKLFKQISNQTDNFNKVGLFVFANEAGKGTLEDYIIPLMEKDNEPIFNAASDFIKLSEEGKQEKKWSEQKALIGVTGQLQKAGKSNAVIITDCDYITNDKIKKDKNAQQLIEFIQKVID
jgi:hypothetical protein